MKWGHRKRQEPVSDLRRRYDSTKSDYKQAKKAYNKAFNTAYDKSAAAYSLNKKKRQENDKRWEDAFDKAEKANAARTAYKQAKKDYKNSDEAKAIRAERTKTALKVGAVAAGTVLATYGAKKLHDLVRDKNYEIRIDQAHKYIDKHINSPAFTKYKGMDMDDWRAANSRYNEFVRGTISNYSNQAKTDKFSTAAKNVAKDYLDKRRKY